MRGTDTETITVFHTSGRYSRLQDVLDAFGTRGGFEVMAVDLQLGTAVLRIQRSRRAEIIAALAEVDIHV